MAYESANDQKRAHNGSGHHPEDLEARLEHTRAEIDETLAAIEHKLTPGELVDQTIDYLRHNGPGEFVANLAEELRARPLPAALSAVGAAWATKRAATLGMALARKPVPTALTAIGLAWFMMESVKRSENNRDIRGRGRPNQWPAADRFERHEWSGSDPTEPVRRFGQKLQEGAERVTSGAAEAFERMRERTHTSAAAAGDTADELRERAVDSAHRATHAMSEAAHRVERTASQATAAAASTITHAAGEALGATREVARSAAESTGRVAHTAKEYTMRGRESTMRAANELQDTVRRHPLVTAMFVAAVGGMVAATLPKSRREEEFLGEKREQLAHTAEELAHKAYDTARETSTSRGGSGRSGAGM